MRQLEVNAIDVFYGPIQALRSLSLGVDEGEMVALLGANGAGKTTTLRTISGMLSPARGEITFRGKGIAGLPAHRVIQEGIAHVPEGRELFPTLTVVENLRLGYWTKRSEKAGFSRQLDRVMEFFPKLRERADQAAGTMSGGEQQMLVVARALMSSPRMMVVDELSLGLAPLIVKQLFDILKEVNREGTAVLLVEQFVHMALENTDRAYVLGKGQVQLEGPSRQLASDPTLIASYLGGEPEAGAAPQTDTAPASDELEVAVATPAARRRKPRAEVAPPDQDGAPD
ncbi:MAG: ABC transporter ATP-binding protein [Candidatus Dormibacteria bacterium]